MITLNILKNFTTSEFIIQLCKGIVRDIIVVVPNLAFEFDIK